MFSWRNQQILKLSVNCCKIPTLIQLLIYIKIIQLLIYISVISSSEMDMLKSNAKQFIDCTANNIQEWRKEEM